MNRKAIYTIIERGDSESNISKIYDYFMMSMVVISIIPLLFKEQTRLFIIFDQVSVVAFIIDYLLRWFTIDLKHPSRKPILAFMAYPFSLMAIIDMLSILPSLGILNRGMKVFRIVRLLKLARVFRFLRYSKRIEILIRVIKKERHVLLTVLGIAAFYIFATALLMFNVELNKASDSGVIVFDTFFDALYWATTTLTTVGYGDVYPVSNFGRAVSMLSSLFGVAVIALPSGVITASYLEELRKNKKKMKTIINNLIERGKYKEPMQDVLRLFAQGNTSPFVVRDTLKIHSIGVDDLHDESIDVILDFVNLILDDHVITKQEMDALRKLKMLLHIKEGDFIDAHKEEDIENILRKEFDLIFQDKTVDKNEAAMKVDLQELFGLSYDQFLLFEQEAVEYALKQGADVTNLDTFYRL